MFGLGFGEILIILVIIILIFGAKRLPEIGAGLGKTVKELRQIRNERRADKKKDKEGQKGGLISGLKKEVDEIPGLKEAREIKETAQQVKKITKFIK
jgi:sec-independent protein translocase protein TatA